MSEIASVADNSVYLKGGKNTKDEEEFSFSPTA
jgi:hypothetical protein